LYSDNALTFFFGIPPTTQTGSINTTVAGGVVGGGVEYALSSHWLVKTEYLHASFGSRGLVEASGVFPQLGETSTAKFSMSIGRAGVDYKW
jgi:opacity protein-like surface antigen